MKKKVASLLLGIMVLAVAGGTDIVSAAGNYTDTSYNFSFQANQPNYTVSRPKRDTTSSYMKCTSCTQNTSYTAHVVATNGSSSRTYVDVSRGHVYRFTSGTTYKMLNWVRESGYSYGAIQGNPDYGYSFSASGVWSPDSI